MRKDAKQYMPFQQMFKLEVLDSTAAAWRADQLEQLHIKRLQATGPGGYNTLKAAPKYSKKFWFLLKAGKFRGRKSN